MIVTLHKNISSYVSLLSSLLLLLAAFNLPISYFSFLRFVVTLGAIIIIIKKFKSLFHILTFLLIAYLFNPLFPVYLYDKTIWIPIDILTALLFLIMAISIGKNKKEVKPDHTNTERDYGRDKIY